MYKALLTDVDGTLIVNRRHSLPTPTVIAAINKVKNQIHVGIATSRPLSKLDKIFEILELSGPCIVSGGTQIYDATTKKIVWEKILEPDMVLQGMAVLKKYFPEIIVNDGGEEKVYAPGIVLKRPLCLYRPNVDPELAEKVHSELSQIKNISTQKMTSHMPGMLDLDVTHGLATKQHGILQVAQILGLDTKEIIGVGDGYNDFPLLMACGLKVAMGNAVDDLKAIADYIAPTVEEDGLAHVIEKFIIAPSR